MASVWGRPLRWPAAATGLVVAGLAGALAVPLAQRHYATAPYHYDSAAYRWSALGTARQAEREGVWAVWRRSLGRKDGLETSLQLLVAPGSLRRRFGHLCVALPALALFAALLACLAARGVGSLVALSVPFYVLAFAPVYAPVLGLTDLLPESIAVWLMGAALAAWLQSDGLSRRTWSALAGVACGLVVWQRAVLAIYLAALLLVPFGMAVWRKRVAGLRAFLLGALPFGLTALWWQGASTFRYYTVLGYDYGSPLETVRELAPYLPSRLGLGPLAVLLAVALVGRPTRGLAASEGLTQASGWLLGLPLLVAGFGTKYHGLAAAWSVLWLVWLGAWAAARAAPARAPRSVLALAVLAATGQYAWSARDAAATRDPLQLRSLFDEVAEVLRVEPGLQRIKILLGAADELFLCQAAFDHGLANVGKGRGLVSYHDSSYEAVFGGAAPDAIAAINVRHMASGTGGGAGPQAPASGPVGTAWALAFCDPRDASTVRYPADGLRLAQPVLMAMNAALRSDAAWRERRRILHPVFRCLVLLRYEAPAERRSRAGPG